MVYPRILNIVPCATQQDLVVYPLYIYQFASANPKLPIQPSPTPPEFFKREGTTLGFGNKCPGNFPCLHLTQNQTRADGSNDLYLCHVCVSWSGELGFETQQEGLSNMGLQGREVGVPVRVLKRKRINRRLDILIKRS